MARDLSKTARDALASTDWATVDAMTDADIARQIDANPDAAPDMAPEIDVRAIRRAAGLSQAEFAAAFEFSVRNVMDWGAQAPKRFRADPAARHQGRPGRRAARPRGGLT